MERYHLDEKVTRKQALGPPESRDGLRRSPGRDRAFRRRTSPKQRDVGVGRKQLDPENSRPRAIGPRRSRDGLRRGPGRDRPLWGWCWRGQIRRYMGVERNRLDTEVSG